MEEDDKNSQISSISQSDFKSLLNEIQTDLKFLRRQMDALFELSTWIANDTNSKIYSAKVDVEHKINYVNQNLYLHLKEAARVQDLNYRDLMIGIDKNFRIYPTERMDLETSFPVARDTDDHLIPWGSAQDNTRSPRFVAACERYFSRPLTYIDLGCAGGGLVLDFILRGHQAYGIEGSDYSKLASRAEWRVLPCNLYTADITKPFNLRNPKNKLLVQCDVISAWEVMEHISDNDLPLLFKNIKNHLKSDGLFIGSIALVPDDNPATGAKYHRTVESKSWWEDRFKSLGMEMFTDHGFGFGDFCRGTSNGPIDENYNERPDIGFHFVAKRLI